MSKAIKTFIILNFVAGIAIAVMGTLLFMEKELIKGRALMLRDTADTLASNLQWGEEIAEFEVEDDQTRTFDLPKPVAHQDIAQYESSLEGLTAFAGSRISQLRGTHTILVSTQNTLRETKATLATRERELAEARDTIASLESDIRDTRDELSRANNTIAGLRSDIQSLESRQERLENDLNNRNDRIVTMEADLDTTIEERDIALERYKQCKTGGQSGEDGSGDWRGRTARILEVNPEWNYVVINKGEEDELAADIQGYVHRGNQYVGRIKVTSVKERVAIAQIIPGSVTEGAALQPGDTLFF